MDIDGSDVGNRKDDEVKIGLNILREQEQIILETIVLSIKYLFGE